MLRTNYVYFEILIYFFGSSNFQMRRPGVFCAQVPKSFRFRINERIWRGLRHRIVFVVSPRLVGYRLVDATKETESPEN